MFLYVFLKGLGSHPQVHDITTTIDTLNTKPLSKEDVEQEPGSEYAGSTESESEEKTHRSHMAKMKREGNWITWTFGDDR